MNKYEIVQKIEKFAPLETQEKWDASGWIVDLENPNVNKILFALTVTDQIVEQAIEKGCDMINGKKEIYLPWKRFNSSSSSLIVSDERAFEIAKKYHPYWDNLKDGAKKLQARNSHQVLGLDLHTPSSFVICWTKDGKGGGGTGQALRIAKDYHIPIFDAGAYQDVNDFRMDLWRYLREKYGLK